MAHKKIVTTTHAAQEKECILCGKCLSVCPLFNATQREDLSPKSKQYLVKALETGSTRVHEKPAVKLAEMCLSCGLCEQACPQNLCSPDLVARLRETHPGWQEWLWKNWITRGDVLWPALAGVTRLLPEAVANASKQLERTTAMMRTEPEIAPWLIVRSFGNAATDKEFDKTTIFSGCLGKRLRDDWSEKAQCVVRGSGYDFLPEPEWECCACTLGHAGAKDVQLRLQQRNVDAWRAAGRPRVAVFCATCRCGLRGYTRVDALQWAPGERELWQRAIVTLSSLWAKDALFESTERAPERVIYHTPCHGSGGNHDGAWLTGVLGERLVKSTDKQCCGMGGVLQLGARELSTRVAANYWKAVRAMPGDHVITGCSGCILQLSATAPKDVHVGHWLDILRVDFI